MTTERRVLHLVDSLEIGGLERLVHDLTIARGATTSVACLSSVGAFGESLRAHGFQVEWIRTKGGFWGTVRRLAAVLRRTRPDILHCHNIRQVLIGSVSAALAGGTPLVFTKHGIGRPSGKMARAVYRYFLRRVYVVAVSEETVQIMTDWMDGGGHPVRHIANGIAMEPYRQLPSRQEARAALGLPPADLVVGTVSRMSPCKNHRLLVDLFARLLEEIPGALLVIAGDGQERPHVERRIQEHNIGDRVVMLGERQDVPIVLSAMDVFCLPSRTEGMPMTVLEAMAASRPVVASRVGGIPELVVEGVTGLLASPDDPGEFVQALLSLARDPARAGEMGRIGHARLLEHFSLDATLASYERLYAEVIAQAGGA
jgi:glycosyltransferase involved in cell wall biosynthesis